MTAIAHAERFRAEPNKLPGRSDRLDYQRFFADSNLPVAPITDQPLDRYQVTLEGIRQIDPDSYRMVLYSWA